MDTRGCSRPGDVLPLSSKTGVQPHSCPQLHLGCAHGHREWERSWLWPTGGGPGVHGPEDGPGPALWPHNAMTQAVTLRDCGCSNRHQRHTATCMESVWRQSVCRTFQTKSDSTGVWPHGGSPVGQGWREGREGLRSLGGCQ